MQQTAILLTAKAKEKDAEKKLILETNQRIEERIENLSGITPYEKEILLFLKTRRGNPELFS
ncbi:MAG: hypothetical protein QW594_03970 [Candidatus Woesearchaeota archaeon]